MAKRNKKEAPSRPLPPREVLFVERYVVCLNATQAAKEAGYSPRSAYVTGCRLLKKAKVKEALAAEVSKRTEKAGVTADRVLLELAMIAYSDLRNVIDIDAEGRVKVRPLDSLPLEVTRAISEITQTSSEYFDEDAGEPGSGGRVVEKLRLGVKQHSKIEALKLLMKYLGLEAPTTVKNEHTGKDGKAIETRVKTSGKITDATADMLIRKVLVGEREGA